MASKARLTFTEAPHGRDSPVIHPYPSVLQPFTLTPPLYWDNHFGIPKPLPAKRDALKPHPLPLPTQRESKDKKSYGSSEIKGKVKMFEVGNGKVIGWVGEDRHYIGRTGYGRQGSALANIFIIGKDGTREEVIAKYRIWLEGIIEKGKGAAWQELQVLRERYKKGEEVILTCYCHPLPFHGDVLMEFINE